MTDISALFIGGPADGEVYRTNGAPNAQVPRLVGPSLADMIEDAERVPTVEVVQYRRASFPILGREVTAYVSETVTSREEAETTFAYYVLSAIGRRVFGTPSWRTT